MRKHQLLFLLAAVSLLIPACQTDDSPTAPLPDGTSQTSNVNIITLGDKTASPGQPVGARLHGANGMALIDNDRLMVTSLFSREINELSVAEGTKTCCFDSGDGVQGADDVLLGPDGAMYWSNFWTGDVFRRDHLGDTRSVFVGLGVGPLALAPDGRLFAARRFLGQGLYAIDPDFTQPAKLYQELGNVGGLAVDAKGYVFASLWNEGDIVVMNGDAPYTPVSTFARGLQVPAGIVLDNGGDVLVAEHQTGDVWKIPIIRNRPDDIHPRQIEHLADKVIEASNRELLAELEPGLAYLEVHPNGHVFVSNGQDGSVIKLTNWGGERIISPAGMIMPGGITLYDADKSFNRFMIADAWSLRLFDMESGDACGVHRCMIDVNGFTAPMTASMGPDKLILSSWLGKVQTLDPSSCEVVETYDFDTAVEVPLNAIHYGDGLVAAGMISGSVFNLVDKAVLADGFVMPSGLATDGESLWVADRATGKVWLIARAGAALAAPEMVASGLDAPEGLAAIDERFLLVVETGADRLTKVDTMRKSFSVVAEGLEVGLEAPPGMPSTWQFNGVTFDGGRIAYVTSDIANAVYEITLPDRRSHGEYQQPVDRADLR